MGRALQPTDMRGWLPVPALGVEDGTPTTYGELAQLEQIERSREALGNPTPQQVQAFLHKWGLHSLALE